MRSAAPFFALLSFACAESRSTSRDAALADARSPSDAAPSLDAVAPVDAAPDAAADAAGLDAAPADGAVADGECSDPETYGAFVLTATEQYGSVFGRHGDAPPASGLVARASEGACTFFAGPSTTCDPVCGPEEICVGGSRCAPRPEPISVGRVTLSGTHPPLTLDPRPGNNYWTEGNLPGLVVPGETVELRADGAGPVGAFAISTRGVPELRLPSNQLTAREHEAFPIPWTPAGAGRIVLELHSDHHGAPAYIRCEADDAESQVLVPAALLDALIEVGRSGIGTFIENAWIARFERGRTRTTLGCAELRAESMTFLFIQTIATR